MKYLNFNALSVSDAASANSKAIDCNQLIGASFHAYFGDTTAAGSIKIQASNDICPTHYSAVYNFIPVNWVDIPGASVTVLAGAPELITIPNTSLIYRWVRVVYTHTSGGTSTITVNVMAVSV